MSLPCPQPVPLIRASAGVMEGQLGSFENVVHEFSSKVAELREATLLRVDGEAVR